jgi:hypothetical protein
MAARVSPGAVSQTRSRRRSRGEPEREDSDRAMALRAFFRMV